MEKALQAAHDPGLDKLLQLACCPVHKDITLCVCVGVQAEQSQAVSQEAVVSYAKELQDMDPEYRPPADIPAALR